MSSLISSYGVLITIGHGLIVGERLSILSWIGIILICISLILIMTSKQGDEKLKVSVKWLAILVFSILCAAAFGVLQRQQQIEFSNAYDEEFMVITLTVSSLLLFIARVIFREKYTGRQYLGVALGCIALILFNI